MTHHIDNLRIRGSILPSIEPLMHGINLSAGLRHWGALALTAFVTFNCWNANAYRIRAFLDSFSGTNSTTAPAVLFSRTDGDAVPNGAVFQKAMASGAGGHLSSSSTAHRLSWFTNSVVASLPYAHRASIEEDLQITNVLPASAIIRVRLGTWQKGSKFVGVVGPNGSVLPQPSQGQSGVAIGVVDAGISINGSPRMNGSSALDSNNRWVTAKNTDPVAVQSKFEGHGDQIGTMVLEWKRGTSREFWVSLSASVGGEVRLGSYEGAYAQSEVSAGMIYRVEASTDNGTNYSPVIPRKTNQTFLSAHQPILTLSPALGGDKIQFSAQPPATHRLQIAPSLQGPWTDVLTGIQVQDIHPVTIIHSNAPATTRFYRTLRD